MIWKEAMKETDLKKRKHTNISRKILYVIIVVITYNLLIVGISAILNKTGKSLFGFRAYIITTESMKPHINSGDIIVIKKVKKKKLETGDVISFKQEDGIITHRIVEVTKNEQGDTEYVTKGDNNNVEDERKVKYDEIQGRKIIRIPFFGKIIVLLQDEVYIILIIILILLIYLHTQKLEDKDRVRREKKEKEDAKFKDKKNN